MVFGCNGRMMSWSGSTCTGVFPLPVSICETDQWEPKCTVYITYNNNRIAFQAALKHLCLVWSQLYRWDLTIGENLNVIAGVHVGEWCVYRSESVRYCSKYKEQIQREFTLWMAGHHTPLSLGSAACIALAWSTVLVIRKARITFGSRLVVSFLKYSSTTGKASESVRSAHAKQKFKVQIVMMI